MNTTMTDLNIVYVNYFSKDILLNSIYSLFKDIEDCKYKIKVTVVDNSQNRDHLKDYLLSHFPDINYIPCKKNIGFGRACTIGFKSIDSRYVFSLNCDTSFIENTNTIEFLIDFMDKKNWIGCIAPKLLNFDESLQFSCFRFNLFSLLVKPLKQIKFLSKVQLIERHVSNLEMKEFDHNSTIPVDWVLGAAMLVRKEVLDQIGGFDKQFFMYFEDCDWCRTMWEYGWPVYYVHDISLKHFHKRESASQKSVFSSILNNRLTQIHTNSWLKYIWKWKGKHVNYFYIPGHNLYEEEVMSLF